MIGYDATLAERANSAGTGELICLFLLFVLFFCILLHANIRLRHYFILSLCLLDLCSSFY